MIVKILGIMDLGAAIALALVNFGLSPGYMWVFAIYLGLKGLIFLKSLSSIADLISVIVIIFAIYGNFNVITWIVVVWLLQKGIISLFS